MKHVKSLEAYVSKNGASQELQKDSEPLFLISGPVSPSSHVLLGGRHSICKGFAFLVTMSYVLHRQFSTPSLLLGILSFSPVPNRTPSDTK